MRGPLPTSETDALAAKLVDHELTGGADAIGAVYEKTFAQLSPIIGGHGVRGIFARALEIVQPEQPLLRSFVVGSEPLRAAATLAPCLSRAPVADARVAGIALYTAFFGLIVTFIGFELTVRLLHAAWPQVDMKET